MTNNRLTPRPSEKAAPVFSGLPVFLTAALLCGFVLLSSAYGAQDRDAKKPNIILILTDDMGYGDIGVYGARMIDTPHLDRMAKEGVRLTDFYASGNICTPSRAGLMTGRYAIRSGLAKNVIMPASTHGLPPEEITIAEMLKGAGYDTLMIGKWHLGHQPEHWPTRHGFDAFFGVPYSNDMQPFALYEGEDKIEEPVEQATLTERYTARAVETINAAGDRPFFIYLAHTFPHIPLYASEQFRGRSQASLYGDVVETLDWSLGEIIAALKERGVDRETLVIFTSDNGPWFEGASGALRARKGSSWEGGFRVPMIARWPGRLPKNRVIAEPAVNTDFAPTLAALAGAALPADRPIDGKDIWPMLKDGAPTPHEDIFFFNNDQIVGVRRGKWKFVIQDYYRTFDVPLAQFQYPLLFDLERDPGETYSFAPDHPDIVEALTARIAEAREEFGAPAPAPFSVEQEQ